MAARCPTVMAMVALLLLASCAGDPGTVLQSDLPQVPGMTGRDSAGLKQVNGVIEEGTFAYKGEIMDLVARVRDTKARFNDLGWKVESERQTPATARLVFAKGNRRATVEIIRNDLAPGMSTAQTVVRTVQAG